MKIPTPFTLNPLAHGLPDQIAALPVKSGIYALTVPGNPAHLSWSANLPRRLMRLLVSSYTALPSLIGRLRNTLAQIECWPTGSKLETALLMYELAKLHFPLDYLKRLRLRLPWFVALTPGSGFGRLTVANRVAGDDAPVVGPFPNRDAAQRYEQEVSGLFQIRRCIEKLDPHPDHPGCIYGEMNLCLRPCQCAVSEAEYAGEASRVAEFLSNNGRGLLSTLSTARDRAAAETDFEQAALIHKRVEKVKNAIAARDEVVRDAHAFHGVALTRGSAERELKLWPMIEGFWQEPITLCFTPEESNARSLDQELREKLGEATKQPQREGNRVEQVAIFARWYYSSWRDGSWFPFESLSGLNYRRLVREISTMMKAP